MRTAVIVLSASLAAVLLACAAALAFMALVAVHAGRQAEACQTIADYNGYWLWDTIGDGANPYPYTDDPPESAYVLCFPEG